MRRAFALALTAAVLIGPAARAQDAGLSPAEQTALSKAFTDAVQQARASLPVFWMRLSENPDGREDYGLKVAFKTPQGTPEELWLFDVRREGARITGRLNYDPEDLPNLHHGQVVPIPEASIIDWTFKEGRKRYGHFPTRVMAKAQPEEEAKTLAALSDNPLPADARK